MEALSVHDQSPIPAGSNGPAALSDTLDLARLADALGYHRYRVAEHHEVIVVTITFDHAARRRSYELLADAFGLRALPRAA